MTNREKPGDHSSALTPPPWTFADNSWEFSTVYDDHGSVVATVPIHHLVTEETQDQYEARKEGIARLISAAPDLLEQGRELVTAADEYEAAVNRGDSNNNRLLAAIEAFRAAILKATQP